MLDGEERVYESIDFANKTTTFQQLSVESYNQAIQFCEQFKNLQETPSGMPPHRLRLKVGAFIILLRNMAVECGLCNGSRLRVLELHDQVGFLLNLCRND